MSLGVAITSAFLILSISSHAEMPNSLPPTPPASKAISCNRALAGSEKVKQVFAKVKDWFRPRLPAEKIPFYLEKKDRFLVNMTMYPMAAHLFAFLPLREVAGVQNWLTLHNSNFLYGLATMAFIQGGLVYIVNFKDKVLLNRFLAGSLFTFINYRHELVINASQVGADYQDFYAGMAAVAVFLVADFVNELKIQSQLEGQ